MTPHHSSSRPLNTQSPTPERWNTGTLAQKKGIRPQRSSQKMLRCYSLLSVGRWGNVLVPAHSLMTAFQEPVVRTVAAAQLFFLYPSCKLPRHLHHPRLFKNAAAARRTEKRFNVRGKGRWWRV